MTKTRTKLAVPAGLLALVLAPALAACGSDSGEEAAAETPSSATSDEAASLTVTDPWVKATKDEMSAAFGTLVNESDEDITVVGATTSASDTTELHETVQNDDGSMAMQAKEGGFTIPAGGEHVLEPGGDHVMLMGLTEPVEAGTTVTVTFALDDGTTLAVEATAKPFTGADENYQDGEHGDMGDMGGESSEGGDH
ncbi:copper chaperone PCu(A)C [Nocardioides sambongensis]|uniref:copper chaperone PCu(A)C n=1 Tax=Nocardioides sambongensis TaxID=2589074 RepID=UPI00112C9FD8|nr:copper chaperone PCu(A)C [Nocardioides sambongensis]